MPRGLTWHGSSAPLPSVKRQMVGLHLLWGPPMVVSDQTRCGRCRLSSSVFHHRLCSFIPCLPKSHFWPVNVLASVQPEGANRGEWP